MRRSHLFLALFALPSLGAACGGGRYVPTEEETHAREAAIQRQADRAAWTPPVLLWQLQPGVPGEDGPSWILGSLPYGVELPDALPAPHDEVPSRAEYVFVDRDPEAFTLEALQASQRLNRRERLDRMLPAASWASLRELMEGTSESELRQLKPWLLWLHIDRVRAAEAHAIGESRPPVLGVPSSASMLRELLLEARSHGHQLGSLDTPETAIAEFDASPSVLWAQRLGFELSNPDVSRGRAIDMRRAYLSRDETQIRAACLASVGPEEAVIAQHNALVSARAARWLPVIETSARRGSTFVAVDVCTLLGENGLLEQLYTTGLRIERLGAAPGTERP